VEFAHSVDDHLVPAFVDRRLAVDNCFADLPVTANYPQLSPTNEPTITLLRYTTYTTRSAQLTLATVAVPAYVYGYTQALASLHVHS